MSNSRERIIKRLAKESKAADRKNQLDKDPKKAELQNRLFDAADVVKKEGIK